MIEQAKKRVQGQRLAAARKAAGYRSARDAALSNDWPESTYRAHESGSRTIGQDDAERYARRFHAAGVQVTAQHILFGDEAPDEPGHGLPVDERCSVPVMGFIGAGAAVDPDFEQVPAEGFFEVEVPVGVPEGTIGFQVRGPSMQPAYNDGDVIVVRAEPQRAIENLIGDEAAIRTYDGKRYLKAIFPGSKRHLYTLTSLNAPPIVDVRIAWASEILAHVKARQTRKLARKGTRPSTARPGEARRER